MTGRASTGRQRIALGDPPGNLHGFPSTDYRAGATVVRAHRAAFGPWWFSTDGSGRFDLPPGAGGTCYLATTACTALREALGPRLSRALVIPHDELAPRCVSHLALPHAVHAADTATTDAARFGVTREISASQSYDLPHAWAAALSAAGFEGIAYEGRFDPGRNAECLALFSHTAGAATYPTDLHPRPAVDVAISCGIPVAAAPARAALTVVTPPGPGSGRRTPWRPS